MTLKKQLNNFQLENKLRNERAPKTERMFYQRLEVGAVTIKLRFKK